MARGVFGWWLGVFAGEEGFSLLVARGVFGWWLGNFLLMVMGFCW